MLDSILGFFNKTIDKIPTDKEKEQLRAEMAQRIADVEKEIKTKQEQELTRRLEIETTHGSWLARNIRPIVVLILTGFFIVMPFLTHDEVLLSVYLQVFGVVYGFYFGGGVLTGTSDIIKAIKTKAK